MKYILKAVALAAFLANNDGVLAAEERTIEVLVYGGTPAGISAAWAAGSEGRSVLLVEPYGRIGGLVTNGLSHPDFRTFEALGGTYRELIRRVESYYRERYGVDSPQVKDCFHGTHAEPHVNQLVFEQLLAEQPSITVLTGRKLATVTIDEQDSRRIARVEFTAPEGKEPLVARATVYIDATYEGDLMAASGVRYRVGREGRDEYHESFAPEQADDQVQGYNFRQVMTRREDIRVLPDAPPGYRREDFLALLPLYESGKLKTVFCQNSGGIYKTQLPLPNGKHDINDVSRGLVRRSMPGVNRDWPDGDLATRRSIQAEHVRHDTGMLYFLQNDAAVPKHLQEEARKWGFCRDEFVDTGHLPEQLYVREARRMLGRYVFTQHDTAHAKLDARAVLRTDAIAMGDYALNCHGTHHQGPLIGGTHTGEFYQSTPPYQIPYGVIVPREIDNLLVPGAYSASHVGFCALRLEPIWMSLGQAAGVAADLAMKGKQPVAEVDAGEIQRRLHAQGAMTIYTSDVPPDHADFAAVEWWGTLGGLHGLEPATEKPGQRGENIIGQYYHAYPGHAVQLDRPLDEALRRRWVRLARSVGITVDPRAASRGEFIRSAHRAFAGASAEN